MLAAQYHDLIHDHRRLDLQGKRCSEILQERRMTKPLVPTSPVDSVYPGVSSLPEQNDVLSLSILSKHGAAGLPSATPNMESTLRGVDVRIKEEEEDASKLPISDSRPAAVDGHDAPNDNIASQFGRSDRDQSQIPGPLALQNTVRHIEQHPSQWIPSGPGSGSGGIPEDHLLSLKVEDDDGMEEDDDVEQEVSGRPLTAAERSAARRKMKRFRLTHQQTRFLMSEFVKQPHPDAAHRDRLSHEIPGLSPRQVQVWFQNRRAKIKRLNAEDRDRVIKMRAVPEDFDNIQALHSPYGAVHGLGPNVASSSQLGPNSQAYGDTTQRPLMVDIRRPEVEDNLSPTGLTPAFEGAGFGCVGGSNSTDLASPLSATQHDRFRQFGGPFSPSLAAITANQSMPPGGQGRTDHAHLQPNSSGMRPLQPLRLPDTFSRPRADSVQSPLRTSVSWKNDSSGFSNYRFGGHSNVTGVERQQPVYHLGSSASSSVGTFDTSSYSGDVNPTSSDVSYSGFPTSPSQQRSRAASATFPLSLDMRSQYGGSSNRSPTHTSSKLATTSTNYTSPSIYTTSYPPAPLTAPINIPQSRTTFAPRESLSDHPEQQMSASAGTTANFSRHNVNNTVASSSTPMRESFGDSSFPFGHDGSRTVS